MSIAQIDFAYECKTLKLRIELNKQGHTTLRCS